MSSVILGEYDWSMERDKDGHRDYTLSWLIETDDVEDGPWIVLNTPSLPVIGSAWIFWNENDPWAFCQPQCSIKPVVTREPGYYWILEQLFSTRPSTKRCQDDSIENPLLEPPRLGGTFMKHQREQHIDRNGKLIMSSSHELFRGKSVEWDESLPTVSIEVTTATNQLGGFAPLMDYVSDSTMWGLTKRKVKLSNATWKRLLYGTCTFYYTTLYEFEVNYETFDRYIPDEGTKIFDTAIAGGSRTNPQHFKLYKDRNEENTRVLLDGNGDPLAAAATPFNIKFERYKEANLLSIPGIPTSL